MPDFRNITTGDCIRIPAGIHHITEPIRIHGNNIRIVGEDGACLHGTVRLSAKDFSETEPGVYSAEVPYPVDAFYVGERKYTMARYPKYTDPDAVFGGYAADCIFPEKTKDWADPAGGYIHAMHRHLWGGYSYRIDGKNTDGTLALSGGWQNNRQMGMHEEYRFAENIREEMTEPGEWVYSPKEGRIYVRFFPGDDPDLAEAAVTEQFFILEDCENVTIENITFRRSVRTFMETREPLLRSDWTICRKGAVLLQNSRRCRIDRCTFRDIGSNGVFADGNCSEIAVTRSHFAGIGASGLCFVGHPESVRSPLFEYSQTQSAADMDRTPGPKTDAYPKNCVVEDCLIEYVGTTEKQAAGVEISMAYGITVKNCTICHTSRAGINISEGTFGGHRIEGCDVFDTVRETGDHGSFNSWGRDRFWHLQDVDDRDCGAYAGLDMISPNVIARNRFRCDHGWDIDLDDGSSNYIITENLCLHGGLKLREGFCRTVRQNITVNDTVHFHVWYPESGDIVENNIVFRPYAPIGMPEVWGRAVHGNILYTPGQKTALPAEALQRLSGQDEDAVSQDIVFASPAEGNYSNRLPGFESFPTEFGVRYAPLRAAADTPVLPEFPTGSPERSGQQTDGICTIGGVTLRNIADDGEMSVYGTAGHHGALVLAVAEESAAAGRGILPGDVVVEYDNRSIGGVEDLHLDMNWQREPVWVLRKQQKMCL